MVLCLSFSLSLSLSHLSLSLKSSGTEWLYSKFQLGENCDGDDDVSWGKLILYRHDGKHNRSCTTTRTGYALSSKTPKIFRLYTHLCTNQFTVKRIRKEEKRHLIKFFNLYQNFYSTYFSILGLNAEKYL